MKYLKKFNNISEDFTPESFISDSYDDIISDLNDIFKGLNYMDEPDLSYKELYNKLLSIRQRSEDLSEKVTDSVIKDELEDISKYCYHFSKSKINLEKLKDLI